MGTIATITLYADDPDQAQAAFVAAFRRIAQLDRTFSDYDPNSELSRVCEGKAQPSRDLMKVLRFAQRLAEDTGGAFDITVGPLSELWREARRQKRLPAPDRLQKALRRTGFRHLQLEPFRCLQEGMKLDAGGIAKGYAADEALATLRALGVTRALVALSGDLAIGLPPPGKPGWTVSVLGENRVLSGTGVSTSGDRYQRLHLEGKTYSHIFDPRTGEAVQKSREVSVIAPTCMEADAVATTATVTGAGIGAGPGSRRQVEVLIR